MHEVGEDTVVMPTFKAVYNDGIKAGIAFALQEIFPQIAFTEYIKMKDQLYVMWIESHKGRYGGE